MEREITGTVVMARVTPVDGTDYQRGFITVLTPHGEYFALDVDAYTSLDPLEEGACVSAHISRSDAAKDWVAHQIERFKALERPCDC